jgi:hypothetical protein
MLKRSMLALALALAGWGAGVRALDTTHSTPPQLAAPNPPAAKPAASNALPANPAEPNPPTAEPAQPNTAPDQAQPNAPPPVAAPQNPPPSDQNQPIQPPDQNQPNAAPPAQPAPGVTPGAAPGESKMTPLQAFASQQVEEVGTLARQMDAFRAAKRTDAVMAMYHMIRDHALIANAAQNVLARRREISEPVINASTEPVASSPEEILRQQIQMHDQALTQTQQLLANATMPEERSIYQRAVDATNKHLTWLRALDQNQPVQIGFFGPTVPLSRIAGYREETTVRQSASNSGPVRRVSRHRRHRAVRHHSNRRHR